MKLFRKFVWNETLLGAMTVLMLLVPSYAQQEIDPSWYDPWAKPSPALAHPSQPRMAHPMNPQPISSRASDQRKKQARKQAPSAIARMQAAKVPVLKP